MVSEISTGDVTVMVLAAGSSRRLGQDKTKLEIGGQSLLAYWYQQILTLGAKPLFVVQTLRDELPEAVQIQNNNNTGLGSSIASGIKRVKTPWLLIHLADQYRISAEHWQALIDRASARRLLICSTAVDGQAQVPALFFQSFYNHLSQLSGDQGAKELLRQAHSVANELASVDIDTPQSLKDFLLWQEEGCDITTN